MKTMATPAQAGYRAGGHSRWRQVVIGVICMSLKPLRARLDSESMPEADSVLNPAPAARRA